MLGIAKRGAGVEEIVDVRAALVVLAAGVAVRASQRPRGALALGAILLGILAMCWSDRIRLGSAAGDKDYAGMIAWLSSHAAGKGRVLSDDAGIPVALGQNPVMDDPFVFAEWAKRGTWSDDAIVAALRDGKYAAVVVSSIDHFWSSAMRRAIADNYALVRVFSATAPLPRCIYMRAAALEPGAGAKLEPYVPTADERQSLQCYPPERARPN
jgi:hypothetical protein